MYLNEHDQFKEDWYDMIEARDVIRYVKIDHKHPLWSEGPRMCYYEIFIGSDQKFYWQEDEELNHEMSRPFDTLGECCKNAHRAYEQIMSL